MLTAHAQCCHRTDGRTDARAGWWTGSRRRTGTGEYESTASSSPRIALGTRSVQRRARRASSGLYRSREDIEEEEKEASAVVDRPTTVQRRRRRWGAKIEL